MTCESCSCVERGVDIIVIEDGPYFGQPGWWGWAKQAVCTIRRNISKQAHPPPGKIRYPAGGDTNPTVCPRVGEACCSKTNDGSLSSRDTFQPRAPVMKRVGPASGRCGLRAEIAIQLRKQRKDYEGQHVERAFRAEPEAPAVKPASGTMNTNNLQPTARAPRPSSDGWPWTRSLGLTSSRHSRVRLLL